MKHIGVSLLVFAAILPRVASAQVEFTASPDPFTPDQNGLGQITLTWSAPGASTVEVRIGSPTGPLFARGGSHGSSTTGQWTWNGLQFLLQDISQGEPGKTIGTYMAHTVPPELPNQNLLIPSADGKKLIYSGPDATLLEIHVNSPSGPLFTRFGTNNGLIDLASAPWVQDGQMFFLQDVSNGHPLDYHYTRAATVIRPDPNAKAGVVFGATSNLLLDSQSAGRVAATLYWYAPGTTAVQIHMHAPNGPLFADGGSAGTAITGDWVFDATEAYLQDASTGDPTSSANTLAKVVLSLQQPVEHFVSPIQANGFSSLYDRESARFLNFLTLLTPTYVSTPDGSKLLAIQSHSIGIIDPASARVTATIDLSAALPPLGEDLAQVQIWMKGPQNQDWLIVGPDSSNSPSYYIVDPSAEEVVGRAPAINTNDLASFNPRDNRLYFALGNSLMALDANLQTHTIATGLPVEPSAIAVLPIGASGSVLWHQDFQVVPFPHPSFSSKTVLFDLQSNTVTDITAETPNLGSANDGYGAAKLMLSFDRKSVYTEGISVGDGGCPFYPCMEWSGDRIVRYGFSTSSSPLREQSQTPSSSQDIRIAGLDDRYMYIWTSTGAPECRGLCGPQLLPPPSLVAKADPNSLTLSDTPRFPAGPSRFGTAQQVSVVTGQYSLDLPACGEWYCDAKP